MSGKTQELNISFLEKEFKSLKMSGFEEKYMDLIDEYENSPGDKASATYSRGLTKDFKDWLLDNNPDLADEIVAELEEEELDEETDDDEDDEDNNSIIKEEPINYGMAGICYDIEDLPRVGKTTAKKLRESGFNTVNSIATIPIKLLMEQASLGEKTAIQLTESAREVMQIGFQTGADVWERRKNLSKISTNSTALDELLDGGIETGSLTEFYGEFRTGKTQIMHQLCIDVQLSKEEGGIVGKALYIDTEGTFRPERIIQMSEAKGLDHNEILKNIAYARAYSSDHQMMICKSMQDKIANENIKLIIVDSLIAHFRSEYIGRGTLADRQQKLNTHIHDLIRIVDMFPEVALVVTNQVQSKPDVFFGDPTRAAGGNILAHAATVRIYLRKGKAEQRVAKVIDAPNLPEGEAVFVLATGGIEDV